MTDLIVTLSCGVRVCVPDSVDLMTPYVLLEQEDWFEDETRFVRKLLRAGDRVLDVGANHGSYTLQAAQRVGPTGRVWAFEPAPAPGECLQRSIALNGFGQVTLVKAAVADVDGEASLSVEANSELSSLGEGGALVRVCTLDACAADLELQSLALVKLDAEGAEGRILDGGASVFERQSPLVLFERIHGPVVDEALVLRFVALGYGIYRLAPGPGILVPLDPAAPADSFQLNLFACKPDRAEALEARGLLARRADDPGDPPPVWRRLLAALPYADRLSGEWTLDQPGWSAYSRVLDRAIMAGDVGYPARERAGHLAAAYAESARLLPGASLPRLLTHARLAWAWGARQEALLVLDRLTERLAALDRLDLSEPFLPVCPRFDQVDPLDRARPWCLAAVLEQRELLGHFSSYFTGLSTLPALDRHAELGFPSPEVERRRHLIRLRHRQESAPCGLLLAAGPGHSNPEFFRARDRTNEVAHTTVCKRSE